MSLEATLTGLVLGERLCWTGLYQRSFLLPYWTRRKRRDIEAAYDRNSLLETSLPFALNQPTDALLSGPGPHTEWFVFQVGVFIKGHGSYSLRHALSSWRTLAENRFGLRLSISQEAVLRNLREGKTPPVTGHDNPHFFDDTACFRALVIACLHADALPRALETTRQDASITNAEDGLWGALAVTAATVTAVRRAGVEASIAAALEQLPQGSWIRRMTTQALEHADTASSPFELAARLEHVLVNSAYNYANAAAETAPLTLAILKRSRGDVERALLLALALPRTAGSVVPLVAALCGALGALDALKNPDILNDPLRGVALSFLKGTVPAERVASLISLISTENP